MVGVVQWLRSPTVTRRMLGSIPAAHPNFCKAARASHSRGLGVGRANEAELRLNRRQIFRERLSSWRSAWQALRGLGFKWRFSALGAPLSGQGCLGRPRDRARRPTSIYGFNLYKSIGSMAASPFRPKNFPISTATLARPSLL